MKIFILIVKIVLCKSGIEIITRDGCKYSTLMRDFLSEHDIDFTDYNTTKIGLAIKSKYGVEDSTFPAVFLNKKLIGGYTDAMASQGFMDYVQKLSANN